VLLSGSGSAADADVKTPVGAETVESVVRAQLSKALGGRRGMLEAAVPTLAFTVLFVPTKDLRLAVGVSVATAVVLLLVNLDPTEPVHLSRGDRVAQLVVQRVEKARFVEVERLPGSARGDGGYGSTGGFAVHPGPSIGKERH
jgi:hypothetical protein